MMRRSLCILVAFSMILGGCAQQIPKDALQLRPESLELRQLQTRSFDTKDEKKLLTAGASVLQDLGFNIDESETPLGVIVGSKDRDAVEAGQVVGSVMVAVLFGVYMPVDKNPKIRASLVTRPVDKKTNLRVTFQRIIWNTQGQIARTESVEDPKIYQEFFEKMSKSVFLEAHEI
jgi:hypothetical protein